jgi:phage baseplate assembly protein gpV
MTLGFGAEIARKVADLETEIRRIRAGLVRVGNVASVDATAGTIMVAYLSGVTSAPMPWFQRGSEHRPPIVGEHVLVLDPSLQGTSSIALVGHPSEANPPAAGGGDKHVLHSDAGGDSDTYTQGTRTLAVRKLVAKAGAIALEADAIELGSSPSDFAALASRVDNYIASMDQLFRTWTPVSQDGGAALKASFVSTFETAPPSVAATHVKVK